MAKSCTKCGEIKELSEFHKAKRKSTGYRSACKLCRKLNEGSRSEYKRRHYIENKDLYLKRAKASYESNKASRIKRISRLEGLRLAFEPGHREKFNKMHRPHNAKRRADVINRTPAWSDLDKIKEIYMNCPKGYHVDHIIPLNGVNVSGLHVVGNLQYLTVSENIKKSNKFRGL